MKRLPLIHVLRIMTDFMPYLQYILFTVILFAFSFHSIKYLFHTSWYGLCKRQNIYFVEADGEFVQKALSQCARKLTRKNGRRKAEERIVTKKRRKRRERDLRDICCGEECLREDFLKYCEKNRSRISQFPLIRRKELESQMARYWRIKAINAQN